MPQSVFFYISGHGFGHAVRQIEIIGALQRAAPDLAIVARTSAAPWLFERIPDRRITLQAAELDTGVVQIDALRLDERRTIGRARAFHADLNGRVDSEAGILVSRNARLVVSDAPALACAAARAAGIPSVVCGNFTWDWIYEAYREAAPGAGALIERLRSLYAGADAGWRLPLGGGFASLPRVVDLPFVARHSRRDRTREELRAELELPQERPLALVSFGGYGVNDLPLDRLDCTPGWNVVVTAPQADMPALPRGVLGLVEERLYRSGLQYQDIIRAVDVVVSKPGYGIISDCIASGAAMLYTPRGNFPEYDVMVAAMPRLLRSRPLTLEDFFAGRWKQGLDAVIAQPAPPDAPRTDGARVAAGLILEAVGATSPR